MQESRLFWKNDGRAVPSVRLHLRWRLVHAQQHGDGVGLLGAGGKPADVLGQQRQLLVQGGFGKLLPLEETSRRESAYRACWWFRFSISAGKRPSFGTQKRAGSNCRLSSGEWSFGGKRGGPPGRMGPAGEKLV